jgi:tetratricopeptide (TPR) repeat protein
MISGNTLKTSFKNGVKRIALYSLVAGLCGIPFQLMAEKYYGVRFAAFNDYKSAEAALDQYSEYGSPVYIQSLQRPTKEIFCVCVGRFQYKVDAWAARKAFREQVTENCLLMGYDSEKTLSVEQNSFPFTTPFSTESVDSLGETEEPEVEQILNSRTARTVDDNYLLVMNARDSELSLSSGDEFLRDFPSDSRRQEVALKMADLCIENEKFAEAGDYINIAIGESPNSVYEAEAELLKIKKNLKVSGYESVKVDLRRTADDANEDDKVRGHALALIGSEAPTNADGIPALEEYISYYPNGDELEKVKIRLARRVQGRKRDNPKARMLLDEVIQSGTEDEVGEAKVLKAYITFREGKKKEAGNEFCDLANDLSIPAHDRLEGMRRKARIAHSTRDSHIAWLAYKQICDGVEDPAERAETKKQMIGLAFELVGSGIGSWEEVRSQCDEVLNDPTAPEDVKATTALMQLETYFHDRDFSEAVSRTDKFLGDYEKYTRENGVALYVKGVSLYRSGDKESAKKVLDQLYHTDLSEADRFGTKNPQSAAALWLAFIAKNEGQDSLISEYLQFVVDHPTEKLLKGAEEIFGELPEPSE